MARSTVLRLRGWWLNVHKWIGLCLAILIIRIGALNAHDVGIETAEQSFAAVQDAGRFE